MLKQALSITRQNLAFYATFVICSVGIQVFDEYSKKSAATGVTFLLSSMLSMNVQNSVLRNLNFSAAAKARKLPFGRYLFQSVGLSLLAILLVIPFLLFFLRIDGVSRNAFIFWTTLVFLPMFAIVLALFGTWLPAGLYGTKVSIGDAFRRGWARFLSTVFRVFAGLAIPLVVAIIASMLTAADSSLDLIVGGSLNIPAVTISVVSNALQAIGWTYVSIVLVRRYMEAEHIEPLSGAAPLPAGVP